MKYVPLALAGLAVVALAGIWLGHELMAFEASEECAERCYPRRSVLLSNANGGFVCGCSQTTTEPAKSKAPETSKAKGAI